MPTVETGPYVIVSTRDYATYLTDRVAAVWTNDVEKALIFAHKDEALAHIVRWCRENHGSKYRMMVRPKVDA